MDSLIIRQVAINAFERFIHELGIMDEPYNYGEMALCEANVPSVQPEIVRCKDCKYWINGHLCEELSRFGSFETKSGFYCGFAERKTDE